MSQPSTPPEYGYGDQAPAPVRMWLRVLLFAGVLALLGVVAHSMFRAMQGDDLLQITTRPPLVMGTRTHIVVTGWSEVGGGMQQATAAAERELRDVEGDMSTYVAQSGISRFNAAPVGEEIRLTRQTMEVLQAARSLSGETDGAFDVTCQSILAVWKLARDQHRMPTEQELSDARRQIGWDKIELTADSAKKIAPSGGVNLGGIAKGYGIDKAVEALQDSGASGGLVDVGGDVRCFGQRRGNTPWGIVVQDPFHPTDQAADGVCRIELREGAVCTSGNYFRYYEIGGRRYSHIVDPRTGQPVDAVPSVTVVAPTAMIADALATALSVLGEKGLPIIESRRGVEAMLIVGTAKDHRVVMTSGFGALLDGPVRLKGASATTAPASAPATGKGL